MVVVDEGWGVLRKRHRVTGYPVLAVHPNVIKYDHFPYEPDTDWLRGDDEAASVGTPINLIFVALGGVTYDSEPFVVAAPCLAYELIVTLLGNLQVARGRLDE